MEMTEVQTADILEEVKQFLPKLINACELIEPRFYEPLSDSFWQKFGEVVQGMDDLYRTLNIVLRSLGDNNQYAALSPRLERAARELSDKFTALNYGVDEEDYIGASDTIKFELIPLFRRLMTELGDETVVSERRFEVNMNFLKQHFTTAYEELWNIEADRIKYQISYCRNGEPNLCLIKEKGKLIYLYSQFDPGEEARRWVANVEPKIEGKSDIMMYGFGLGYHAKALAEKFPNQRLTVYEPDRQLFLAAMRVLDFETLFGQLNIAELVVGTKKNRRDRLFYKFLKYTTETPQIVELPMYYRIDKKDIERFSADGQLAILNYAGSLRLYIKFGWEWLNNCLYNLPAVLSSPSVLGLKNAFSGMTAVVVGAGPSLAEDIEALRKLKNHALIISAGSSIQSLLYYGIEPHLIVSMDGGEPNYQAFQNLSIQHIPFLFTPMIKHKIIDEQKDNLIHVHFTNDPVTGVLMDVSAEDALFAPNHSVTGTAIQAAIYMGCREIVLTGQDLSFPDDHYYAPGARHMSTELNNKLIGNATQTVENVRGGKNRTNNGMKTTLADIEDLLADHPEIRFTNTSGLGARIKHTSWEPMTAVVKRLEDICVEADIVNKKRVALERYDIKRIETVCKRIVQLPNNWRASVERLERIDQLIGNALEWGRTNARKSFDAFMEIDKLWKQVVNDISFKAVYFLLFRNDLVELERDLPQLTNETNLIRKAELAELIMRPLIRDMLSKTSELTEVISEAVRRIHVYMTSSTFGEKI